MTVTGAGSDAEALGLPAAVSVKGASATTYRLTVNALDAGDVIDASPVPAGAILLTLDGGEGDDVLIGGPGTDTIDGGTGDNVVLDSAAATATDATAVSAAWLEKHARVSNGKTVLTAGGEKYTLPRADLDQLLPG